jgi:hypothetical protein
MENFDTKHGDILFSNRDAASEALHVELTYQKDSLRHYVLIYF